MYLRSLGTTRINIPATIEISGANEIVSVTVNSLNSIDGQNFIQFPTTSGQLNLADKDNALKRPNKNYRLFISSKLQFFEKTQPTNFISI